MKKGVMLSYSFFILLIFIYNKNMEEKIYKLTQQIDNDLQYNNLSEEEKDKIAKELKPLLPEDAIVLAQTNPTSGDIKGNAKKAFQWIKWAQRLDVDTIVFPEMYLIGYPIGDFIDRFPLIVEENIEWLEAIAQKVKGKTKVIIGFAEFNKEKTGKKYFNSIAIINNGKIERVIRKSLIPNYAEFNDYRHFEPSPVESLNRIIQIGNKKAGIIVCEDGWNDFDFFDKNLYSIDPVETVVKEQHPDYLINCSASITRAKKEQLKHNMLGFAAKKHKTPIVYVNQTGSGECMSFEGASRAYDAQGNLIAMAKSYQEQFFVVSPTQGGDVNPLPKGLEKTLTSQKAFTLDHEPDLERTYLTIVQSIRDYFNKTGFKRAVLGLSGGLDSTVSAVLLADALGAQNVFGISMPSKITSAESKNDAKELAQNLGINFTEISIKDMYDSTRSKFDEVFSTIEKHWDNRFKESFTNDNIQARSRALILWGIANEFGSCLPIATSDKSELYMGYATINGDMSGGFAPLADVSKTKLFALARWMNNNRKIKNAIPESIIKKRPGAELAINPKTGKPLLAEEALMPYEFLDEVIWRVENLQQTICDMMNAEFLHETHMKQQGTPISKEQKLEWLQKFFRRMSTALYKWTIMPPSPIVDARSINKTEYRHPVISSKINYHKTSFEDKLKELF